MKKDFRKEDNDAIQRCLNGDETGFRELVERYQRRAIGVALGYVKNIEDAQDIVQDAFMRTYRNLATFDTKSHFFTWFYRIVVNACIDDYRKKKKRRSVEYDDTYIRRDVASERALTGNTKLMEPHMGVERVELYQVLNEALDKLSENHRTVITLREIEDLSYEEIADILDIQIGTVMSRLHHARKKLQVHLKPYLNETGEIDFADRAGDGVGTKRTST